ncbi:MAG: cysteine hydrolase family protein [Alphaproteobacteria bacterium]
MIFKNLFQKQDPIRENDKTLAEFFGVDAVDFKLIDPSEFTHVVIDVQKEFCDPSHPEERGTEDTHNISSHIARIMPKFRAAGLRTVVVYYDDCDEGYDEAFGGPHMIQTVASDVKIAKHKTSAFEGSYIDYTLKKENLNNLFISGFNASSCVLNTVRDALRYKYNVVVLQDCVGIDKNNHHETNDYVRKMQDSGAYAATSAEALEFFAASSQNAPYLPINNGDLIDQSELDQTLAY